MCMFTVGLKLNLLDHSLAIDLQYLGVCLPIPPLAVLPDESSGSSSSQRKGIHMWTSVLRHSFVQFYKRLGKTHSYGDWHSIVLLRVFEIRCPVRCSNTFANIVWF